MPDGKTHRTATAAIACLLYAGLGWSSYASVATYVTAGCLIGLAITPDLDLVENRIGKIKTGRIRKAPSFNMKVLASVISLGGFFWNLYWYPYGKMIAHRSSLSHLPIVGTVVRSIYIAVPVFLLLYWIGAPVGWMMSDKFGYAFVGLCVSDLAHVIMDVTL